VTIADYRLQNAENGRMKQFCFCSLLTVLLLALPGCRVRTPDKVMTPPGLQVGIIAPSFDYLPLKVAEENGLLARQNVSYQRFNSGWELGEALIAGKVDLAIIPFTYVISAAAQGSPVRIIATLEHEDDGVIARPGIDRLEQLAGKKVGCLKASTIELLLRQALSRRGIKAELVFFSSPMEMWSALEHGDVDALSYYVPGIIRADRKIGNIVHWYCDDWPMHPCCDVAVHLGRIRNKIQAVRGLLKALRSGTEIIAQDTARAISVAVKTYGLTDSIALQSLRRTPFRLSLTKEEMDFELATARQMKELGYIKTDASLIRALYLPGYIP
jgi:ABC-type nitrate/sulfonate/bicarbonate transport system substrate-binding protein